MRKSTRLTIVAVCVLSLLTGCGQSEFVEGSEAVYEGIVVDLAKSDNRAYIGVEFEGGDGLCFYAAKGEASVPGGASLGDNVRVSSMIEEKTELPIAISVEIMND